MVVFEGSERGKGSLGLEEGRTFGATLTRDVMKMMAAQVWYCRVKRELPFLVRC